MIRQQPAEDVIEHVRLIRQKEVDRLTWQLNIELQPHRKRADQKRLVNALRQMSCTETLASPYDMAAGDEKVRLVGCAIAHGGEQWKTTHVRQMEWLREKGISPDEAVRLYRSWKAEQDADPFWKS